MPLTWSVQQPEHFGLTDHAAFILLLLLFSETRFLSVALVFRNSLCSQSGLGFTEVGVSLPPVQIKGVRGHCPDCLVLFVNLLYVHLSNALPASLSLHLLSLLTSPWCCNPVFSATPFAPWWGSFSTASTGLSQLFLLTFQNPLSHSFYLLFPVHFLLGLCVRML